MPAGGATPGQEAPPFDEDPMVIMELLPVTPQSVVEALARTGSPAA